MVAFTLTTYLIPGESCSFAWKQNQADCEVVQGSSSSILAGLSFLVHRQKQIKQNSYEYIVCIGDDIRGKKARQRVILFLEYD